MAQHAHVLPISGRQRGFTIVEIVIAFIIIGILTVVMVPVMTKQTSQARINAAGQDLQHLCDAEERAAVDTNYLYRPYVLNDGPQGDGVANLPGDRRNKINGIRDNGVITPIFYRNPSYIFISPTTQDFIVDQVALFTRLTGSTTGGTPPYPDSTLLAERNFNWNGPYVNWSRDVNMNDWPDDPWGHDYVFFTQKGLLYPPERGPELDGNGSIITDSSVSGASTGTTAADNSFQFQDRLTFTINNSTHDFYATDETVASKPPLFDRPTWVSLGPDGIPGSLSTGGVINTADPVNYGFGRGDDIVRSFGGN